MPAWSSRVHAAQFGGDPVVHILHGLRNALAAELLFVAVAKFPSFVDSGAGAAGNGRAAERAIGKRHIDLHGRIAAAVENLASLDIDD